MASGLFALLDDISMLADDVAAASKIATQKTTAILGDDLAVNAQKATGFDQSRELKIIWAITKGSLVNKLMILPIAFILNALAPSLITYILILGGIYLIYEGIEKIDEYRKHRKDTVENKALLNSTKETVLDVEAKKIKSAIFTDFILSIEIVIIALSSVADQAFVTQVVATSFVAILATFGVYGFVALIVRMDNAGFWLIQKQWLKSGQFLIDLMPRLIQILSIVGTVAMLLVGGGILYHHIGFLHAIDFLPWMFDELLIALIVGIALLLIIKVFHTIFK